MILQLVCLHFFFVYIYINTIVTSTSHAHTHTHTYTHTQVMSHVPSLDVFDDKHYQNKCRNKPSLLLIVAATVAVSHDMASGMV